MLCCVLGQGTLISQCSSPLRCKNEYWPTLEWTGIPSSGTRNTSSHSMQLIRNLAYMQTVCRKYDIYWAYFNTVHGDCTLNSLLKLLPHSWLVRAILTVQQATNLFKESLSTIYSTIFNRWMCIYEQFWALRLFLSPAFFDHFQRKRLEKIKCSHVI